MYPITLQADYVAKHNRLTTFFRGIMTFPALIVTYLYGLAAGFAIMFAWFAIIFTGRYPEGLYNFVGGYVRNSARVNGYYFLLTDLYPPFNGEPDAAYPVRVDVAPRQESYSRLKAFFKYIIAIPIFIVIYVYMLGALIALIIGWFAILFTGKLPRGIHDYVAKTLSLVTKSNAYLSLMTDVYPPFSDDAAQITGGAGGSGLPSGGAGLPASAGAGVASPPPPPPPAPGF